MLDDMFRKSGGRKAPRDHTQAAIPGDASFNGQTSGHRLPYETAAKATKPVTKRWQPACLT
jgi:hypothetical protein